MKMSQVLLAVTVVMGISVLLPAADATGVSYCLRGCGACVVYFGKDLYDGRKCAATCQQSAGMSRDEGCGNEMFHLIKRGSNRVLYCKKYCGMCVLRYSKQVYDGLRCIQDCHLSGGQSIDMGCEQYGYGRTNEVLGRRSQSNSE